MTGIRTIADDQEATRKREHEKALNELSELGRDTAQLSLAEIQARITRAHQLFRGRLWQEFAHRVVDIRARVLATLRHAEDSILCQNTMKGSK
ncbi:MAG TPA: hypothetical protein VHZ09_03695 [Acidobacteriaceae bacterium]|jgi:hypothetical protein|nr:hypothetical protein [Acidobacteriaceae bacterium]